MLLAVGLQLQVIQNFAGKISLESVPDELRLGHNTNYTAKKRGRTEKKYGNKKSFQQNYDD